MKFLKHIFGDFFFPILLKSYVFILWYNKRQVFQHSYKDNVNLNGVIERTLKKLFH